MQFHASSSAAHGKRVRRAIGAHRLRSPLIALAARRARLAEPPGHLVGIEAKARAAAAAEAVRPQLVGVVVDPPPADAPPVRDLLGGECCQSSASEATHRGAASSARQSVSMPEIAARLYSLSS